MDVRPATLVDHPAILELLRGTAFPDLPRDGRASAVLATARNFMLERNGELIGWVGLHDFCGNWCKLDVAINPKYRGKWLTKGLLKQFFGLIFDDMKVERVYVESVTAKAIKLAHGLGFKMTGREDETHVQLVLTRSELESLR